MDELIKALVPIIITFIIGVLTVATRAILQVATEYINLKKEAVIKAIGRDKYDSELLLAKNIWNIVEEHFRINQVAQNVASEKILMFNNLLLKKCPYLKQEDIDHLRQAIAGEANAWKSNFKDVIQGTPVNTLEENAKNLQLTSDVKIPFDTVIPKE